MGAARVLADADTERTIGLDIAAGVVLQQLQDGRRLPAAGRVARRLREPGGAGDSRSAQQHGPQDL